MLSVGLRYRQKSGNDYEKCVHAQGKGELALDTWPNRLVLRLSLQSETETNVPLKSGPALAGPAGPATPPLYQEISQGITSGNVW